MAQHSLWATYSGTARVTLAVILLIAAAGVVYAGTRLRRPVRLPHPGRITTNVMLAIWVAAIVAFLAGVSAIAQHARQEHLTATRPPDPITPVTYTAVAVVFVVIVMLGRSHAWPARLASAAIGALAAPMIFELPFDLIVMARTNPVPPDPVMYRVIFFAPLFLIELTTLSLLAASPMVRLRRITFFGFAAILVVFAIWALFGFGYPSTSLAYALNVVSKILAFATALTLFLPWRDPSAQPVLRGEGAELVLLPGQVGGGGADHDPGDALGG